MFFNDFFCMQPRSHVGAVGKRPRTSLPQPQPSQPGGYHQGPPMPSKRFPNLGSGISISFSGDSEGGPSGNNSRQPQQAPMRKPMPSTSRGMQQPFSSNNRYLFLTFQKFREIVTIILQVFLKMTRLSLKCHITVTLLLEQELSHCRFLVPDNTEKILTEI